MIVLNKTKNLKKTYLSALSTRAPALIKAKTACEEPADAAHNNGCRPSLSTTSTDESGCSSNVVSI